MQNTNVNKSNINSSSTDGVQSTALDILRMKM